MKDWRAPRSASRVSTAALKPALRSLMVLTKATGPRGSVCKRKVGVLVALTDKRAQITTRKAVLRDDLRPYVGVITNIRRKAGGLIGPHIYP